MQQYSGHHPISSALLWCTEDQVGMDESAVILRMGLSSLGNLQRHLRQSFLGYRVDPIKDQASDVFFLQYWNTFSKNSIRKGI